MKELKMFATVYHVCEMAIKKKSCKYGINTKYGLFEHLLLFQDNFVVFPDGCL